MSGTLVPLLFGLASVLVFTREAIRRKDVLCLAVFVAFFFVGIDHGEHVDEPVPIRQILEGLEGAKRVEPDVPQLQELILLDHALSRAGFGRDLHLFVIHDVALRILRATDLTKEQKLSILRDFRHELSRTK